MIITEAEARTKWCPHTRVTNSASSSYNRWGVYQPKQISCVASDCMMWEWLRVDEKHKGYCGLGNKRRT